MEINLDLITEMEIKQKFSEKFKEIEETKN